VFVVEVDDRLDVVLVVDEADMASDRDIAVVVRGRRQLARQLLRRWVRLSAEVSVENGAFMETGLLVRRESVLVPQALRRMVPVVVVPVARHLLVTIVKPAISASIVSSIRDAAGEGEQSRRRPNCQTKFLHRASP
jgi:hypothetical protein